MPQLINFFRQRPADLLTKPSLASKLESLSTAALLVNDNGQSKKILTDCAAFAVSGNDPEDHFTDLHNKLICSPINGQLFKKVLSYCQDIWVDNNI